MKDQPALDIIIKTFKILPLVLFLTSCATYSPKVIHDPDNIRCGLDSKKRTLKVTPERIPHLHNCPECLIIPIVYTSVTALFSGTVVLIGNTFHSIEKFVKCDDSVAK